MEHSANEEEADSIRTINSEDSKSDDDDDGDSEHLNNDGYDPKGSHDEDVDSKTESHSSDVIHTGKNTIPSLEPENGKKDVTVDVQSKILFSKIIVAILLTIFLGWLLGCCIDVVKCCAAVVLFKVFESM